MVPNWVDRILERYARRLQLLRGAVLVLRGSMAGVRFGIGRNVQVSYPSCLCVGHNVTIFDGAYIRSVVPGSVQIGSHTDIHMGFWLDCGGSHNEAGTVTIGDDCLLQPYITVNAGGGSITIGNHVIFGSMVGIHAGNHVFCDPHRLIKEQGTRHQGIVIEDDCWIGAKVTILDGVTIGRGSVVGAGAVVAKSLPPFSVAAGVPAQIISMRGEERP